MKKTILALTIASSVVLLTGCNAEDDVVDNYGSTITTTLEARSYAGKVNAINDIVIQNVIKNCITPLKTTCDLQSNITHSLENNTYHMSGAVKLSKDSNGLITIETLDDKNIKLKNGGKDDFKATFNNSSDNHHKITLKEDATDAYIVTFYGQYLDNDADQFQSKSTTDFKFTTNGTPTFKDGGKGILKGKGDKSSWTWDILTGEVHIIDKI